ncbi:MAG: hypothetical protein HC828_21860, partial [Blastochloris sp.]|nr:hypothetical protein [Blastochloris sp.]
NVAAGVAATAQSAIPTRSTPTVGTAGVAGATTTSTTSAGATGTATGTPSVTPTLQPGEVVLAINNAPDIPEGNSGRANANFAVTLAGTTNQVITVRYATSDTSAEAPSDYEATSGTLTFQPGGATSQTITVPVIGDTRDESNETFRVTLSNPTNATLSQSQSFGIATIVDDDGVNTPTNTATATPTGTTGPLPSVSFTTNNQTVDENVNLVTVRVNLSTSTNREVRIPLTTGGSATINSDFNFTNNQIIILAGEDSGLVTFNVFDDSLNEINEAIEISMGTPTNATPGATTRQTVTINDNDPLPRVDLAEDVASVSENVGTISVQLRLSQRSGRDVSVQLSSNGGSASNGGSEPDYNLTSQTITILAGNDSTTISFNVVDDTRDEPNETIALLLSQPSNAILGTATRTITINDNDDPPPPPTNTPTQTPTNTPEPTSTPTPEPEPENTPPTVGTNQGLTVACSNTDDNPSAHRAARRDRYGASGCRFTIYNYADYIE